MLQNDSNLNVSRTELSALDRARRKAYWRLLPLLALCYVVAYVDRSNVGLAKLTMVRDLPLFDNKVIGYGAGVFFVGYFLLEIPGSLLVERWSARKWICRIMVTWGFTAALTALVKTPQQFYFIRFLLGLAEAGFFPGVIIYLTHWFPGRDRTRAIACFMAAAPLAQITSPRISYALLRIGTTEIVQGVPVYHPPVLGLQGWQWMYIAWGIPAVILGLVVLFKLPDKPQNAKWLSEEEKQALKEKLAMEKATRSPKHRMKFTDALSHPKVLLLAFAFFCGTTGTYGIEFFLPSILERWYSVKLNTITWLVTLPPCLALCGQLFAGWNSDRTQERRLHAFIPVVVAGVALGLTPWTQGHLAWTIVCFMIAVTGLKAYQPAFWSLPTLFLSETAAAASIGLINSIGNLGGFLGPYVIGAVDKTTGSFVGGIYFVCGAIFSCAVIVFSLQLGGKQHRTSVLESD